MGNPYGYYESRPLPAILDVTVAVDPTAPASTSAWKMQGLGALITPVVSGILRLEVSANVVGITATTTVGAGIEIQGFYQAGGSPPANAGAIPTGAITFSPIRTWASGVTFTTSEDSFATLSVEGIIVVQVGQQYWFDVAALSFVTASEFQLQKVHITAFEIT